MDPRRVSNRVPAWMLVGLIAVGVLAGGLWVAGGPGDVPTATANHPSEPPFPETLNASTSIELSRGPCLGDCPIYEVTICGDGTVHYLGGRRAETTGYVQYSIPRRDVGHLLVEAYEIDFFAFERRYSSGLSDGQDTTSTVNVPGDSHTVTADYEVENLSRFEDRIDDVASTEILINSQFPIETKPWAEAPEGCG